jgi:hypothetical protein
MREATGGRGYYNCQWAQEDVETLYNLLNNNNNRESEDKAVPVHPMKHTRKGELWLGSTHS